MGMVRYTAEEIRAMNERGPGIDRERAASRIEEEIERLAREENEALGVDPEWYRRAVPVDEMKAEDEPLPELLYDAEEDRWYTWEEWDERDRQDRLREEEAWIEFVWDALLTAPLGKRIWFAWHMILGRALSVEGGRKRPE